MSCLALPFHAVLHRVCLLRKGSMWRICRTDLPSDTSLAGGTIPPIARDKCARRLQQRFYIDTEGNGEGPVPVAWGER